MKSRTRHSAKLPIAYVLLLTVNRCSPMCGSHTRELLFFVSPVPPVTVR